MSITADTTSHPHPHPLPVLLRDMGFTADFISGSYENWIPNDKITNQGESGSMGPPDIPWMGTGQDTDEETAQLFIQKLSIS